MRETAFCYWSKKQTIYLTFSWQHSILTFSKLYDNLWYQRRFKSLQDSRSMITFTSFISGFICYMNQSIGNWIFLSKTKLEWKYEFSFLKESAKSVTHKSFQNFINILVYTGPAKWILKWRNSEKYCRPTWLANKKNFWILDALQWLKQ